MFSLSLWISFHRFRPGLLLGPANRTQSLPLRPKKKDSRVIVTLAPGHDMSASLNDLLHIKREDFNR